MRESSVLELSRSALRQNLAYLREQIGPRPLLSAIIKGNAYGHGIDVWVPLAEKCGVHHFGVFSADEAERALKVALPESHIMIMGHLPDDEVAWAVDRGCSFFVFDLGRLKAAVCAADKQNRPARVHLEVETGLHRTGFDGTALDEAVNTLKDAGDRVQLDGICTHLAGAESSANCLRIQRQLERFNHLTEVLHNQGLDPRWRHAACSAATLSYPSTVMDMVRVGIAHYGFWPSDETRMHVWGKNALSSGSVQKDPLRRVLRWRSSVMDLKDVPAGEYVGYGHAFMASRNQRLAAVPVGYYHGFARHLSNLGYVLVHGRRAPVAGMVNMNMMMVDVTDIPNVQRGDEVVIIGKQRRSQISVSSFSDLTGYLTYEVLVRLPADIPRIVVA
ncbi:MAG: alanine racemase [Pseudomonadota bacterium]